MGKDDKVFLRHILECVGKIEIYLQNCNEENFQRDIKTVDAVVRNVEVIGEAATNLSEDLRGQNA